jgi:hypothetical protein
MGKDAHFTQHDVFATFGNGRHLMMGDDPGNATQMALVLSGGMVAP